MQITINVSNDFSSLWIDDGVKPTFSYKIKNPELMEEIIRKYHLNRVDDIEGIDSFITKTILDNNHISSSQNVIKSGSYIDLTSLITSDKIVKRYMFVLYEEYKIVNNELIELNSQYIPTIITYSINSNEEFVLQDYWALNDFDINQSIKDVFPKGIVYDEFDQELYIKMLKDENLDKVEDALFKHNKKTIVDNIVKDIKKYDNGYTDKDYFNAKGEGCLHPRLQYESKDIKIEIWSDPHRLFCYVVKINDLNSSAKENIYIDSSYYEALQKELEKYDLVKSYI